MPFRIPALLAATLALLPALSAGAAPADTNLEEQARTPAAEAIVDEVLGRLAFDETLARYGGKSTWASIEVEVFVEARDRDELDDALAHAHALWAATDDWDARARRVAAEQLLAEYNEQWRDDDPELDAETFAARIAPTLVVVRTDGSFEIWYDDDRLFSRHAIRVEGSIADGPQGAYIDG